MPTTQTLHVNAAKSFLPLPLRTKIDVTMPAQIDWTGRFEIASYLQAQGLPLLQDGDVEWVWETSRGSLPKRLAKVYKHQKGVALPPAVVSQVGNLARRHSSEGESYTFDFTRRFNWYAGDFGDHGSCYWGCRSAAREMLEEAGAYAIRFYDEDGCGFGRAWLMPVRLGGTDAFVLFNGYGYEACTQAAVLAHHLGLSYKEIPLYNEGDTSGTIYINCDGYLIGQPDVIEHVYSWDLEIPDTERYECCDCGRRFSEDDVTWVDGDCYCDRCYSDSFYSCDHCGEGVRHEDAIEIGSSYYCEHCAERYGVQCDQCGGWMPTNDGTQVDDQVWCESCVDNTDDLEECPECGELTTPGYMADLWGDRMCLQCKQRLYHARTAGQIRLNLDLASEDVPMPAAA